MSPAMVETLTPATPDSSTNPKKAQIFLSDQAPIMDQSNLGHSLFPPVSLSSSPGKPSLSKPRLAKTRKSTSMKPRAPSAAPDRSEKIEEKLAGWNPFLPESKVLGTDRFVFGSGANLSRNSSRNSSLGSASVSFGNDGSVGSGSSAFVFREGSCDLSRNSSIGSDEERKLNAGKSGSFTEGVFVFGSSVEESSDRRETFAASPGNESGGFASPAGLFVFGNSSKESSDNVSGASVLPGGFVFGSGMKEGSEIERSNIRETSIGSGDNVSGDSAMAGVFVFGKSEESKAGVDVGNGFVFGKSENLEKFNTGTETENFVGAEAFKYTFDAGKQDNSLSNCGGSEKTNFTEKGASGLTKETGLKEQVDADNGFVCGISEKVSGFFGGSAVNTLHDNMTELKSGRKVDSFVGSIPLKFSFGPEQYQSSSMGSVPPFQATVPPPCANLQQGGAQFTFASQPNGLETQHMEFKTPKHDASKLSKENLFSGRSQNIASSVKRGEGRGTRSKKKKGKSRQAASYHRSFAKEFVPADGSSEGNPETVPTDGYSPMDYSPCCEETVATDQYSRETSILSDDSIRFVSRCASTDTQRSISVEREKVLVSAAEKLDINEGHDVNHGEHDDNGTKDHVQSCFSAASSFEGEQPFGYGNESGMPKYENVGFGSLGSNIERQASTGETGYIFSSSVEDFSQPKFSFTSSPFVQGPLPAQKRNHRRKSKTKPSQASYQTKPGPDSYNSASSSSVTFASPSLNLFAPVSVSMPMKTGQEQKDVTFVSQNEDGSKEKKNKEPEASNIAALEACEKWRYRGNQAYSNGFSSKAEDYYTRGINSVSLKENNSSRIRPLTLCYSNRAATRMSLGRMREAIDDCKMALTIDPNFLRAQVRAANCYLSLGEIEETLKAFKKCLQAKDINSNQKILTEASDGLEKAQHVADLTGQCAELLLKRTLNDASKALQIVSEALLISPLSESLMEMKAEALLAMREYEEVIQFCEETLDMAEKNYVAPEVDSHLKDVGSSELLKISPARLWRWHLISKSYFYLGKLEEALELLRKHEKVKPAVDKYGNRSSDSLTSLAVTIRELLRLKAAGNEAFQAARHSEAVECYTAALLCNAESRPFAAVCFGNRAAAYQAQGQIADAIADCSLAIALDASYPKAISRRATLHEMIRDYGQAANDLHRLIALLENRMKQNNNQSEASRGSTGYDNDLRKARMRLVAMEEEAKKGRSLNMYMILGVEPSSSAADVKKAYRKAALRHHPDKAGQFLVRNENVDGLWREVANEVHTDADRLFKMIGESYTILSDPNKRLQYDADEEMRTSLRKGYNGHSVPKTPTDSYYSHYERKFNMHQSQAHGSSYRRW